MHVRVLFLCRVSLPTATTAAICGEDVLRHAQRVRNILLCHVFFRPATTLIRLLDTTMHRAIKITCMGLSLLLAFLQRMLDALAHSPSSLSPKPAHASAIAAYSKQCLTTSSCSPNFGSNHALTHTSSLKPLPPCLWQACACTCMRTCSIHKDSPRALQTFRSAPYARAQDGKSLTKSWFAKKSSLASNPRSRQNFLFASKTRAREDSTLDCNSLNQSSFVQVLLLRQKCGHASTARWVARV